MNAPAPPSPVAATLARALIWVLAAFLILAALLGAGALTLRFVGRGALSVVDYANERLTGLLGQYRAEPQVFREHLGQHQQNLELGLSRQRQITQIELQEPRTIMGQAIPGSLTKVTAEVSFFANYGIKLHDPSALELSFTAREGLLEVLVAAPGVLAVESTHLAFRTDEAPILGPAADALKTKLSGTLPAVLRERARAPERLAEARRVGRRALASFVLNFLLAKVPDALGDEGPVRFIRVRYQGEPEPPTEATVFSVSELRLTPPATEPAPEAATP